MVILLSANKILRAALQNAWAELHLGPLELYTKWPPQKNSAEKNMAECKAVLVDAALPNLVALTSQLPLGRSVLLGKNPQLRAQDFFAVMPLPVKIAQLSQLIKGLPKKIAPLALAEGVLFHVEELRLKSGNKTIRLTEKEAALLLALYRAGAGGISRALLLQQIWRHQRALHTHTLATHIYRLRQKLKAWPKLAARLVTLDDGYQLQ